MTEQERQGGWQFPPIPDVDCMRGIQRKTRWTILKSSLKNTVKWVTTTILLLHLIWRRVLPICTSVPVRAF